MTTTTKSLEKGSSTLVSALGAAILLLFSSHAATSYGYDPNGMKGTCINDVGRGAMLWGSSNEVTTYSSPYMSFKTPNIYRIPTTDETTAAQQGSTRLPAGISEEDWRNKLREVGTILGTDGKLYEYYFVEGVEPRRIVETQRVREVPKGGISPIWTTKTFEHIEMEPVLIRVLRPIGTSAKISSDFDKARAAIEAPQPCESVGAEERRTFADESAANTTNATNNSQNPANDAVPPVEGTRQNTVPPANSDQASGFAVDPDGTFHVFTPDRVEGNGATKPVLVLPEEVRRKAAAQRAPSGQTRAR